MQTTETDAVATRPAESAAASATQGDTERIASAKRDYFDLITEGVGYLNQVRKVSDKGKGAKPFLACSIQAFTGPGDNLEKRSLDLIVVSRQAIAACEQLRPEIDARKAVIVGFRFGDVRPDQYVAPCSEGPGELRLRLKGRLLEIVFAKVDGQTVILPPLRINPEAVNRVRTGTEG